MTAEDRAELRSLVGALTEEEQHSLLKSLRHSRAARRPGALRDQIRIADDFDTLPQEIAAAFGAAEQ